MGIAFERIIIVMLENSSRTNVLANPYMSALRTRGVFLSNTFGVTHPSQPNYIASISGDLFGFNGDDAGWAQRCRCNATVVFEVKLSRPIIGSSINAKPRRRISSASLRHRLRFLN